jgi:hypothetical protein
VSGFENFARQAEQIELEIERKGIALGIDWHDPAEVAALAREALDCRPAEQDSGSGDPLLHARHELFGLAHLMLQVMEESAREKIHTHGGPIWKIFGRADLPDFFGPLIPGKRLLASWLNNRIA